jgi:predicted molibdopterin-dependent oxidoreductase YjgC
MINFTIDGQPFQAAPNTTVLAVAREHHIHIPTLCFHPALKPSGTCRLCAVEVPGRASGRPTTMLACILKVREGLSVRTTGDMVQQSRQKAFRRLMQLAPQSEKIRALAAANGVDLGAPPDGCIRCRLCIRVCKEVVGPGALKMEKRDGQNYVVPIEGACIGCGTCANICPTQVIQVTDYDTVRTITIRDDIIGKHPLERCEGCGRLYATPKFLNHIDARTDSHPDVKAEHHYCATCAKLFSDRVQSFARHPRRYPEH